VVRALIVSPLCRGKDRGGPPELSRRDSGSPMGSARETGLQGSAHATTVRGEEGAGRRLGEATEAPDLPGKRSGPTLRDLCGTRPPAKTVKWPRGLNEGAIPAYAAGEKVRKDWIRTRSGLR